MNSLKDKDQDLKRVTDPEEAQIIQRRELQLVSMEKLEKALHP